MSQTYIIASTRNRRGWDICFAGFGRRSTSRSEVERFLSKFPEFELNPQTGALESMHDYEANPDLPPIAVIQRMLTYLSNGAKIASTSTAIGPVSHMWTLTVNL